MEKVIANSKRWYDMQDLENEIWKDVVDYEGLYMISSEGRVKRLRKTFKDSLGRTVNHKERILAKYISKSTGYYNVNLSKNKKVTKKSVHTLIADAFIPNPDNLPCINHIDEDRSNSVLSNIERCTYLYNNTYGTAKQKRKATLRKNLEGKHKTIYQFSLDGNLINVYNCGVSQLEEKLGYLIGDCLTGKSKTAHGYYYSYNSIFNYKEDLPKKHQRYVVKIDDSGNEIERYSSLSKAGEANGFDRHLLSKNNNNGISIVNGMRFIIEQKQPSYG